MAQHAFEDIKRRFTTAPNLRHPDPDLPIIVAEDAYNYDSTLIPSESESAEGRSKWLTLHFCLHMACQAWPAHSPRLLLDEEK
ncbi:uncharacterized mitochondrial protein AtMg00860-like [Tachysurus ichikawai]